MYQSCDHLIHRLAEVDQRSRPDAPGRFVARLEEQKQLLKGSRTTSGLSSDGPKSTASGQATTKQPAVRPSLKTDASGHVVMSIKFEARPVEFGEGEAGIVVGSKDKLPALIQRADRRCPRR